MKIYSYKCDDCGSKKYEKLNETTYRCTYCGSIKEVYIQKEEPKQEEPSKTEPVESEPQPIYDEAPQIKNVSVYDILVLIFTIVFGYLGVHRFMRGKIITGLLYLFTYGLFCIGWGFDVIREIVRYVKKYRGYN